MSMMTLCYSILFSRFLQERGASSTTTAWIFNVHLFLWGAVGILTGPLTNELGFRGVSFTCALAGSISVMAMSFSTTVLHLFVFFSICGKAFYHYIFFTIHIFDQINAFISSDARPHLHNIKCLILVNFLVFFLKVLTTLYYCRSLGWPGMQALLSSHRSVL